MSESLAKSSGKAALRPLLPRLTLVLMSEVDKQVGEAQTGTESYSRAAAHQERRHVPNLRHGTGRAESGDSLNRVADFLEDCVGVLAEVWQVAPPIVGGKRKAHERELTN